MSHHRVGQILERGDEADVRFGKTVVQLKRWVGSHAARLQRLSGDRPREPSPGGQFYMSPLEAALLLVLDNALQLSPLDRRSLLIEAAEVLEDVAKDDGFLIESTG